MNKEENKLKKKLLYFVCTFMFCFIACLTSSHVFAQNKYGVFLERNEPDQEGIKLHLTKDYKTADQGFSNYNDPYKDYKILSPDLR